MRQILKIFAVALIGLAAALVTSFAPPVLGETLPVAAGSADSCIVELTGDVNESGSVTAADVIYTVNFVFLRGSQPTPCRGAADVNCSGTVTTADVIGLVAYIFKSTFQPCDICQSAYAIDEGCIQ